MAEDTREARIRAARWYLATVPLIEGIITQTLAQLGSLSDEQRKRVGVLLKQRSEALERSLTESLIEIMTAQEIEALARFYATPEGQSVLRKMPLMMADAMNRYQPIIMAVIEEVSRGS